LLISSIFFLFHCFFIFLLLNFCENGRCIYGLRALLRAHQLPHFLSILELTWLTLWILTRWLLERMHFQPFPSAWNATENRKLKKSWKNRRRREERPDVNLILSHVNHTFSILDPWIGPQAFRYTYCTLRKKCFF